MKNFNWRVNLPLFLFIVNFTHISYLLHIGHSVSVPAMFFSLFVILMYGFNLAMDHIRKPDAHKLLEESWRSEFQAYAEKCDKELGDIKNIASALSMNMSRTSTSDQSFIANQGWR
jgi:hypothetical protein